MSAPAVELDGLGVRIGETPILRNLDMNLAAGEAIGLVGANGSGKTTLLRVIATLLPPTEGSGRVLGASLRSEERFEIRHRIGLIGHVPSLYPNLTLEENVEFVARIVGRPNELAAEALDRVGLAAARSRRAVQCSHGMQRRVEFARILLCEPDLVLLDEAHAGLDAQAADLVALIVKDVTARDGAAILVSHEYGRIQPLVGRLLELQGGRLEPMDVIR